MFFFFKQKTSYEMRISDWSSDVCSSDLLLQGSEEWLEARRGLITASNIGKLITPTLRVADNDKSRKLTLTLAADRKSVVKGKSGSVSVDLGGRRIINKKNEVLQDNVSKKGKLIPKHK